jgi:hypothetical protein
MNCCNDYGHCHGGKDCPIRGHQCANDDGLTFIDRHPYFVVAVVVATLLILYSVIERWIFG